MDPMPTQVEDAAFLTATRRAALWSEPGTGKTLSAILALKDAKTARVIAPAVALGMWRQELDAHGLHRVTVESWGKIAKIADDLPPVDALVLDEAHYAVRGDAQRTRAIYGAVLKEGLTQRAGAVYALTGTPMIRFADDLWPCVNTLWPEHLAFLNIRGELAFTRRYCTTDRFGDISGSRNSSLRLLHDVLGGKYDPPRVVIRRTLAEVAPHLPPLTVRSLQIELSSTQRGHVDRTLPPNWVTRLVDAERGLAEDPVMATARRLMSLLKVSAAAETIRDAPGKVIVIFVHTETGMALRAACKEPSLLIEGRTPADERQPIVDAFNRESGPRVLFGQMAAMGVAINPHKRCRHMVFVERDWSAAALEQAIGRVRRIGQTKHQQVDFLDTDHPLDLAMRRVANRKLRSMGILVGDVA